MKTHKLIMACWLIMMGLYAHGQACQANFYFTISGNVVQFHDTSYRSTAGTNNSYQWTFGDGTSSTSKNPSHTYAQSGVYNVCLTFIARNTFGGSILCTDTFCQSVTIGCPNPPTVSISGLNTVQVGQSVTLTAVGSGGSTPYQYNWSTGSIGANITVSPTTTTNYCVTVYDHLQCSATACHSVSTYTNHAPVTKTITVSNCPRQTLYINIDSIVSDVDSGTVFTVTPYAPQTGTLAVSGNYLQYTSNPTYTGIQDYTIYYQVCDNGTPSICTSGWVVLDTCNNWMKPYALNDSTCSLPSDSVVINVLSNDQNLNGPSSVSIFGSNHGTATVNSNQTITFIPTTGYNGGCGFYYKVCNSNSLCDTAFVYVSVTSGCVNQNPCANPPQITLSSINPRIGFGCDSIYAYASGGTGPYQYTWNANNHTNLLKVCNKTGCYAVTVSDASGCSATASYCYYDMPPYAYDDTTCTTPNSSVIINVLANDTQYVSNSIVSILGASTGTAVVNSNKSISFAPTTGFNGTAIIYYQLCNLNGWCDTGRVAIGVSPNCNNQNPCANPPQITLSPPNPILGTTCDSIYAYVSGGTGPYQYAWNSTNHTNGIQICTRTGCYAVTVTDTKGCTATTSYCYSSVPPYAYDDSTCTTPDSTVLVYFLSNDQQLNNPSASIVGTSTGTATLVSSAVISYVPNAGYTGTAYIYYSICNQNGLCDTGRVTVWVSPNCNNQNTCANPPVVTVTGSSLINAGQSANLTATATGGTSPYSYIWSNGSTGTVTTVSPTTTSTYCVTVYDNLQCSATFCKTVQVNTSTLKPIAFNDTTCTTPSTAILVSILSNDQQLNNPTVSIVGTSTGTSMLMSSAVLSYEPNAGYTGTAFIDYSVCNANGFCDTARVVVLVSPNCTNQNPCANPPQITLYPPYPIHNNTCDTIYTHTTGGTGPYQYAWNSSNHSSGLLVCVRAGCYTITVTDAKGCTATATYCYAPPTCHDTICGEVFNDINGNGVKDAGEKGIANSVVYAGNSSYTTDSTGHYEIVVPCGTNNIYNFPNPNQNCCVVTTVPIPNPLDSSQFGYYTLSDTSGTRICGFNFGYQNTGVTISGYVYLDANNNGVKDPGENGVAYQSVAVGGSYAYTDQYGYYVINKPAGNYNLTCVPYAPYAGATVNPTSINLNASTVGTTYPNNNFGLHVQGGVNLSIDISQISNVAPGYPAMYWIDVCNVGTVTTGGVASMYYDPKLVFDYASPAQNSHNASSHTLSFNVPTLVPGDCVGYYVVLSLPTSVAIGTPVFNLVTVTPLINPDINLANNKDTIHQIVEASWDPNNKLANGTYTHPETSTKYILPNTELEYTVNFQNTGTAPAVDVIIKDALQANVDVNSFRMLGSSHNCQVLRDGNTLNFKFSNIMLPDSTHDEKRSHGFVRFAVKPNTAAVGTIINNTAEIFFDYNDAVVTNTTENVIAVTTGIDGELEATNIVVAPNPFSSFTTISVKGVAAEEIQLTAFDLTGRIVANQTYANPQVMQFNRNELKQGVYIYELKQHGQLIGKGKLVIE